MSRAPIKTLPEAAELRKLFVYAPDTGGLRWISNPKFNGLPVGKVGTVSKSGYLVIGVGRRIFAAHRIAWKMMTGDEPPEKIDHINGDKLDNRWVNLRAADNRSNLWNSKLRTDNTSGFKGVQFRPEQTRSPWRAILYSKSGRRVIIGSFATPKEASKAWQAAAQKERGEFMRVA